MGSADTAYRFVEQGIRRLDRVFAHPLIDGPFGEAEEVSQLGIGDFVVGDLFVEGGFSKIEIGGQLLDGHDLGGHGGKLLGCEGRGSAWFGLTLQFCGSGTV